MLKEVGCRLFPGLRPLLLAGSAPTRTCKKANAGQLSKVDGTCTPESHDADSQERKDGCDAVDKDTVQYYTILCPAIWTNIMDNTALFSF